MEHNPRARWIQAAAVTCAATVLALVAVVGCGADKSTNAPTTGSPFAGQWRFVFAGDIHNSSSGPQEMTVSMDGTIADNFHAIVIENGSTIHLTGAISADGAVSNGALKDYPTLLNATLTGSFSGDQAAGSYTGYYNWSPNAPEKGYHVDGLWTAYRP